jgi:phosphohistidine phosphatase
MHCVLFRHGIAVSIEDWGGDDQDRPLTMDGREKTHKATGGLLKIGIAPTHILASPFKRTQETAHILKKAFSFGGEVQLCHELLSEVSPHHLFPILNTFPSDACILCIGHEPHLGSTAGVMLFGEPVYGLSFKKAGGALISFEGPAKAGRGILQWWIPRSYLRGLRKT